MNRKTRLLALALGLAPLLTYGQSKLEVARTDYNNFRTVQAKEIYEQIWKASAQHDKIAAGQQLVNIRWKFYKDYQTAQEYTDSLLVLSENNFDVLLRMADISIQAEEFKNAEKYLSKSQSSASNDNQMRQSRIKHADNVLAKSMKSLLNKEPVDLNEANKALGFLKDYYLQEPEDLRLARLYFGIALLLEKDTEIMHAWRTYFGIPQNEKPTGLLAQAEENIRRGLEVDSEEGAISLAKGLAGSRFFDYAVMVMFQHNLDYENMADLADIYSYCRFLKDVEELIYDYYREKSLGGVSDNKYYKAYYSLCIDFWYALNWQNGKPLFFYEKAFEEELFKRFGSMTFTGKGSDQIAFFVGHSVVHDNSTIEQYGRQAKITYLSLDNMTGNIYPHWYFGFFGVGGWAIDNQIIRIRTIPINNNSPLRAFYRLSNDKERENWLAQIKEKSIQDDSIAISDPYAFLEGLSERLKYQSYSQILDSLRRSDNEELKIRFLSYVNGLLLDAIVYNHEGRHLLDSYVDYPDNTEMFAHEEREFRAKLSEVALSKYPKLAFAEGILRPEGGGASEKANKRVIQGVVEWMNINKISIKGIDDARPLLPQLDLLTDEQLVTAIRSFDPLYAQYKEGMSGS